MALAAPTTKFTWTGSGDPECDIWFGSDYGQPVEHLEWHEGWYPLEFEEDYEGMRDQMWAEECGLTEMDIT